MSILSGLSLKAMMYHTSKTDAKVYPVRLNVTWGALTNLQYVTSRE